ncbi:hypothetical protein BK120_23350 [Paenibacillus sp. FSL A5-0031]|uniref:hypothetical protein n=1 Tax=Paenibacillus sp. FSL A5-0031 TaxID=1920420 RepID=UPI00096CEEAA|nr:hypothetical protein [Paenibacillus sp. FSL A5-0031]OME78678.1 hypothetical protein BK120_23350 [Paenibacillus sp. FSL A5-0031]
MKTNCECLEKNEEWHFEEQLECWYAIRECASCTYYWEGPDHSKTNRSSPPLTGIVYKPNDAADKVDSIRNRPGQFLVYCYDEHGRYGSPVGFNEVKDIFQFCELNKFSHKKIKVISDDQINVLVQYGSYVFPKEWTQYN